MLPLGNELFDELIVDRGVDEQARTRAADFALIGEDAVIGGGNRLVHVGQVSHEHLRRLTTAFEPNTLHVRLSGVLQH